MNAPIDPELRTLLAAGVLGKQAENFLNSDLGRMVMGIADQEAQLAMDNLKRTAAWRRRRIAELQNEIWRAESFKTWLTELVIEGQQAAQQLDEREE